MKALLPVRRALGVRTVLHALGPLLNPAGARRQVMGVYSARLVPVVAEAMTMLGTRHAFVVHGDGGPSGGLDELALSGSTEVAEVREGDVGVARVREYRFRPEDAGLARARLEALAGGDAAANAAILRSVFAGERGARRDVILLNAAAVLVTAGRASDISEGVRVAAESRELGGDLRPQLPAGAWIEEISQAELKLVGTEAPIQPDQSRNCAGWQERLALDHHDMEAHLQARQPARARHGIRRRGAGHHEAGRAQDAVDMGTFHCLVDRRRQAEIVGRDDDPAGRHAAL